MPDEKTMSTCLRLPLDVRAAAESLGDGNITEGISLGVRFATSMKTFPGNLDAPLLMRTINNLTKLLSTAVLVNRSQEERIRNLEAALDLVQSAEKHAL